MSSRAHFFCALSLALVGCSSGSSVYGVVVEDALIAESPDPNGWCGDGSAPTVSVVVRTARTEGHTSAQSAPASPVWVENVLVARHAELANGLRVDVVGQCKDRTIHFGAAHFVPSSGTFTGRTVVLQQMGAVGQVRLHLQRLQPASSGGSYYYEGGYYEVGSDYGDGGYESGSSFTCYDDGTCLDDESDWASDDDWSADDSSDDSSSDDSDDSSWDDSSDSGSDDSGSDDCGCSDP